MIPEPKNVVLVVTIALWVRGGRSQSILNFGKSRCLSLLKKKKTTSIFTCGIFITKRLLRQTPSPSNTTMVKSPERAMIAKKVLNTCPFFVVVSQSCCTSIPWSFRWKNCRRALYLSKSQKKHTNKKETFAQELKNKNSCFRPNLSGAVCAWGCK